jgi:hypothetical protein
MKQDMIRQKRGLLHLASLESLTGKTRFKFLIYNSR